MDKAKREAEIVKLREQGFTYRHIASLLGISRSLAQRIYSNAIYKRDVLAKLPPLRRILSKQAKDALVNHFGTEAILDDPHTIALSGSLQILKIKNIGRKSLRQIAFALHAMGAIQNEGEWLFPYCGYTESGQMNSG